jgi:hypothetical protein
VGLIVLATLQAAFIQVAYQGAQVPVDPTTATQIRYWSSQEALKAAGALSDSLDALKAGQELKSDLFEQFVKKVKVPRKPKAAK